ncbi:YolD-like family protein [Lysinibacillus sp. NPDC086135]|uniref:YolD-like family protein n=1 Tax=Lysinibacillus sp. NPDC086135 TaxID=3364130 RepID=UPI0038219666
MLNDRGNMKWTAMMLPEHLMKIKEWKQEQYYDKKRELTEWEMEEIEQIVQLAYKLHEEVKITFWSDNKLHDVGGKITAINAFHKELLLDIDISIKRITFDQIQKASMVNIDD